ncbi:cytochrome b [Dyella koreensis]|uniref:Cytochrome b n=1 Tax=Dyella koreensis TaxID=311235 RepID=A0ABW8K7X6_9GAMM
MSSFNKALAPMSAQTRSTANYTRTAKVLHWLAALFILTNFVVGLRMEHFPGYAHTSPEWNGILFWHGSIGALVLWLAVARMIWRAGHRPPPLPGSIPAWQAWVAHSVHGLLYLAMLALPLSGYAHRVAGNHAVSFFGLWNWPDLFSTNESLRVLFGRIHIGLVVALGLLLLLHFGAVLKHLVINRDGVAKRML